VEALTTVAVLQVALAVVASKRRLLALERELLTKDLVERQMLERFPVAGGGGASAVGVAGGANTRGNGGAGVASSITGSSVTRGGGGGNGYQAAGGTGGTGGGGNGGI
jgi:hypothetical protein